MKKLAFWINEVINECQNSTLPKEKETRSPFFKKFKQEISENIKIKNISLEVKKYMKDFPMP
jgi:hypothetical protein